MKIFKIITLLIAVSVIAAGGYAYLNRHNIFDYNINKIIKNLMPAYLEMGELKIDLENRRITVKDFKVRNAEGFIRDYLVEVDEIECVYTQKNDENILEGISVKDIDLIRPIVYIVRQEDSTLNAANMQDVFKVPAKELSEPNIFSKAAAYLFYLFSPVKKIEELIEIEPVFNIKNGKFIFDDFDFDSKGYKTTIEGISADVKLDLRRDFKGVDYITSKGSGYLNAIRSQIVNWNSEYNPNRPELTMSNTFKIDNIDFMHFEPYYDKFSPFIFKSGRVSGDLIFNFDNGDIGSTNEVRFADIDLELKKDFADKNLWDVNAEDLYKYFSSPSGEIVFDFKIKGPMEEPKFYLGSKAKRALTKMVVYKITDSLFKKDENASEGPDPTTPAPQEEQSDVEKIIDIFKNIRDKYKSED